MAIDKPYVIGVAGGSGSGKSRFVSTLKQSFSDEEICLMTQDNYYLAKERQPTDARGIINFDLPASIDSERMADDLQRLLGGHRVELLEYTFNNPSVDPRKLVFEPAPVIVVEGILVFHFKRINAFFDLRVFIEASEAVKVQRRIHRDGSERGYAPEDVRYRYAHHVTPVFQKYVEPWRDKADLVIPNNVGFDRGLQVLGDHLRQEIDRRML